MAYFDGDVLDLLIPSLHDKLPDMTYGGQYAAIVGLFQKGDESGSTHAVAIDVGLGGGMGATYSNAYTNASLVSRVQFNVTPFKCYGISVVPLDQNAFTKGPESAAVLLLDESEKAMNNAKLQLDQALAGDGYGTLATVVTPTNTGGAVWTITVATQAEILKFTPGMVLTQKTAAATASLNAGSMLVTNVNVGSKTLTVTATTVTPTAGRVLGIQGTQLDSTAFSIWPGIPAAIPPAAARPVAATAFYGVDRSTNEQKLAGSYLDGSQMGILEGILQLEAMIANVPGAKPDTILCSFLTKAKIMADCQTQRRYIEPVQVKGPGIDVYFPAIRVHGTAGGYLDIIGSSNWSDTLVAVLDRSTWHCDSPGNQPIVPASGNGNPVVENPAADNVVVKFRCNAFVYTDTPGNNGMLTISA